MGQTLKSQNVAAPGHPGGRKPNLQGPATKALCTVFGLTQVTPLHRWRR